MFALRESGEDPAIWFVDFYLREKCVPKYGKCCATLGALAFKNSDSCLVAGSFNREDFHFHQ